jgi:hypothetical protein
MLGLTMLLKIDTFNDSNEHIANIRYIATHVDLKIPCFSCFFYRAYVGTYGQIPITLNSHEKFLPSVAAYLQPTITNIVYEIFLSPVATHSYKGRSCDWAW